MLRYESEVWMLTIQVLGGMFMVAFLLGCIYECCRRKKNRIQGKYNFENQFNLANFPIHIPFYFIILL